MALLKSYAAVVLMGGLFLHNFIYSHCLSLDDVKPMFDNRFCIVGTLMTMEQGKVLLWNSKTAENSLEGSSTEINNNYDVYTKKPMERGFLSLIHELAAFNKIDHYYYLIDEQGAAHEKIFKVELHLGSEKYAGEGTSIKKARNSAAEIALGETRYAMPPEKVRGIESTVLTPTVQLNNLAMKLGMKVTYVMHNDVLDDDEQFREGQSHHNTYNLEIGPGKSHLSRLNHSIYYPYKGKYTKIANENTPGQPFSVVVYVGDKEYSGSGYTIQAARHAAAANALKSLSKLSQTEIETCLAEGGICNLDSVKSPTSLVYEAAQKQNLPVEFTVVSESGPAHERMFVTECRVGDLVTKGDGKSKKASKRNASEKMLKKLELVDGIVSTGSNLNVANKKKKKLKKNKVVIKSATGKISRDAQNLLSSAYEYFVPDDTKKDKNVRKLDSGVDDVNDPKLKLLDLMQQKGVPINFLDLFETASKYYSLLSLGIHPQHLCLGEGISFVEAHRNASLGALNFLDKFGFNNIVPSKDGFEYIDGLDVQYVEVAKHGYLDEES